MYRAVADTMRNGEPVVIVDATCDSCKAPFRFSIPEKQWLAWTSGQTIQRAIPSLSADERELLISGTCGNCFDALFEGVDL